MVNEICQVINPYEGAFSNDVMGEDKGNFCSYKFLALGWRTFIVLKNEKLYT